jgi:hypothetical protein
LAPLIARPFGKKAYPGKKLGRVPVVTLFSKELLRGAHQAAHTRLDSMAALQAHGAHGKVALAALLGMPVMVALEATAVLLPEMLETAEAAAEAVEAVAPPT